MILLNVRSTVMMTQLFIMMSMFSKLIVNCYYTRYRMGRVPEQSVIDRQAVLECIQIIKDRSASQFEIDKTYRSRRVYII